MPNLFKFLCKKKKMNKLSNEHKISIVPKVTKINELGEEICFCHNSTN